MLYNYYLNKTIKPFKNLDYLPLGKKAKRAPKEKGEGIFFSLIFS